MTETIDTAQPEALRLADLMETLLYPPCHTAAAELRRLHSALAAAEARNATLTDDAARLDFVGKHIGGGFRLDDRKAVSSDYIYWGEYREHKTPREAIDAAIQARAAASISTKGDGL